MSKDQATCECGYVGPDEVRDGKGKYARRFRHTPLDNGWAWADSPTPSIADVLAHIDEGLEWFDRTYRPHLRVDTAGERPDAIFDFQTSRLSSDTRTRLLTFAEALAERLTQRAGLSETARIGGAGMLMALHHALTWMEIEAVTHEQIADWETVENVARAKYQDAHPSTIHGLAEMEVWLALVGFWEVTAQDAVDASRRKRPLAMSKALRQLAPAVRDVLTKAFPGIKLSAQSSAAGCLVTVLCSVILLLLVLVG